MQFPILLGILPVILLPSKRSCTSDGRRVHKSVGKLPDRLLLSRRIDFKEEMLTMADGNSPVN